MSVDVYFILESLVPTMLSWALLYDNGAEIPVKQEKIKLKNKDYIMAVTRVDEETRIKFHLAISDGRGNRIVEPRPRDILARAKKTTYVFLPWAEEEAILTSDGGETLVTFPAIAGYESRAVGESSRLGAWDPAAAGNKQVKFAGHNFVTGKGDLKLVRRSGSQDAWTWEQPAYQNKELAAPTSNNMVLVETNWEDNNMLTHNMIKSIPLPEAAAINSLPEEADTPLETESKKQEVRRTRRRRSLRKRLHDHLTSFAWVLRTLVK